MPFSKEAQRRGGSRPATQSQKEAARRWALENRPSKRSTGPRTPEGKATSYTNVIKRGIYQKWVASWRVDNFEAACQEEEAAIAAFEADRDAHPIRYSDLKVMRLEGDAEGKQWRFYLVHATLAGTAEEIEQRTAQIQRIRQRYGAIGEWRYTVESPGFIDLNELLSLINQQAEQSRRSLPPPRSLRK